MSPKIWNHTLVQVQQAAEKEVLRARERHGGRTDVHQRAQGQSQVSLRGFFFICVQSILRNHVKNEQCFSIGQFLILYLRTHKRNTIQNFSLFLCVFSKEGKLGSEFDYLVKNGYGSGLRIVFGSRLKVIRKFFIKHNKSFRWHLGDYEKHNCFPFEGL